MTKTCTSCRSVLPLADFFKDASRKDGLAKSCKPCEKLRTRRYYAKMPRMQKRKYILRYQYQLSLEDYELLLSVQEERCAICRHKFGEEGERDGPCVDHDHNCCPGDKSCGRCIRGLLCWRCNVALGLLRETSFDRITRYLKG